MLNKLKILLSPDGAGGGAAPAAPVAPAKAAPSATPAPAPAADTGGDPNPFDALDGMIAKSRGKEPPKDPDKKDDADKDKGDLRDKTKDTPPADKKDDKAAPDPARKIESGPKALRDQLEKTNGELKTHRERVATLEAKITEYEAKGKDTTVLAERLKAVEAEKEAVQAELRAIKREASPEFKEKFEKPFKRAADTAEKIVLQLQTASKEDEAGTVIPGRKATWDDFIRIYNMDYGQAQEEAEKLFGKNERVIMSHYDRLHGLQDEKNAALDEERAQWKAKEEKDKADAAVQETHKAERIEEIKNLWRKVNAELVEQNPERYAPKPNDKEEAGIVAKAYELWEAKPQTYLQQIAKDANLRNRLASEALAQHRLVKARDRIAELETALAEAKGSRPGDTRRPGGTDTQPEKTWDQDLKETLAA